MKVYRIALTEFCDVSGEGAKLYGGRWNLPGSPAIYAGSSISACLLERLTVDPELLSSDRYLLYSVMEFDIPDHLIHFPALDELPDDWNQIPAINASMEYGSNLLRSGILCLAIPSIVDPTSTVFMINPLSPEFEKLQHKTYPLNVDQRIRK